MTERGEHTAERRRYDFAVAAPWLCAALVLGVEALHRSPALAIVVGASSLGLLALMLTGSAIWTLVDSLNARHRVRAAYGPVAVRPLWAEQEADHQSRPDDVKMPSNTTVTDPVPISS